MAVTCWLWSLCRDEEMGTPASWNGRMRLAAEARKLNLFPVSQTSRLSSRRRKIRSPAPAVSALCRFSAGVLGRSLRILTGCR